MEEHTGEQRVRRKRLSDDTSQHSPSSSCNMSTTKESESSFSVETLSSYLQSVSYGEEETRFVQMCSTLSYSDMAGLQWNFLLRTCLLCWRAHFLREDSGEDTDQNSSTNYDPHSSNLLLQKVLVRVKADSLLYFPKFDDMDDDEGLALMGEKDSIAHEKEDATTTDLMAVMHVTNNNLNALWSQDPMLRFWTVHQRYRIVKNVYTFHQKLSQAEQFCLREIIRAIDQIAEYQDVEAMDQAPSKVAESDREGIDGNGDDISSQKSTLHEDPKDDDFSQLSLLSRKDFGRWLAARLEHASGLDVLRSEACLLKLSHSAAMEGSRSEVYQKIRRCLWNHARDPAYRDHLAGKLGVMIEFKPDDSSVLIRGKALCLHLLLSICMARRRKFLQVELVSNSAQLAEVLAKILANFTPTSVYSETLLVGHILTCTALHLDALSTGELEKSLATTWSQCVQLSQTYLQQFARCCTPEEFMTMHDQIDDYLVSSKAAKGIQWWKEVAWDLLLCCKQRIHSNQLETQVIDINDQQKPAPREPGHEISDIWASFHNSNSHSEDEAVYSEDDSMSGSEVSNDRDEILLLDLDRGGLFPSQEPSFSNLDRGGLFPSQQISWPH